ncbi:hypothetical protein BCR35DRAFT_320559 [Leucosporidium creatinivorum]|uniref:Survival motor neuron interacting protein 1-domain-containing protein n=1 Tax=Leucosporidium creatinivorum TaxID=106004 RepID=A0A1Y2FYU1_9BASI|nr:hypothetical protein BCR35DRAFT_320559 [Leucosporidium creatinivorum]
MADPLIGFTMDFSMMQQARDPADAPRGGLGSQCFPVAELEDDFEGEPEDGMEYLFLVRREAEAHPRVNRVSNPYVTVESLEAAPQPIEQLSKPSEAWRAAFVKQFEGLRSRMTSAPPLAGFPPLTHNDLPLPQDESGWRTFIHGRKVKAAKPPTPAVNGANGHSNAQDGDTAMALSLEDAKAAALASLEFDSPDSPPKPLAPPPSVSEPPSEPSYTIDPDHPAHVPSPSLLLSIPTPHVVRILSHFDEWFQERIEAYEAAASFVPSTIFAPPALRKKVVNGSARPSAPAPAPRPSPARPTPRPPLPTSHEAHWILSLLARAESLLAGDDISSLRILVRTILGLVEESDKQQQEKEAKREAAGGGPRSMAERNRDEEDAEGRAHCWMIVAAVAEGWAQRDLWNGD